MRSNKIIVFVFSALLLLSCASDDSVAQTEPDGITPVQNIALLSLGDSYTVGQGVCSDCGFPPQLAERLDQQLPVNVDISYRVIAGTGWTTSRLLSAISGINENNNYDLVTLLIGVNNQFQNLPFSVFETEFPQLVDKAIALSKTNREGLIVISIPDYAYTPFGQGSSSPETISAELDAYNTYIEDYCSQNGIKYVYITDITRQGLDNPDLVASDGLHPSESAYGLFVERLLPVALEILDRF